MKFRHVFGHHYFGFFMFFGYVDSIPFSHLATQIVVNIVGGLEYLWWNVIVVAFFGLFLKRGAQVETKSKVLMVSSSLLCMVSDLCRVNWSAIGFRTYSGKIVRFSWKQNMNAQVQGIPWYM